VHLRTYAGKLGYYPCSHKPICWPGRGNRALSLPWKTSEKLSLSGHRGCANFAVGAIPLPKRLLHVYSRLRLFCHGSDLPTVLPISASPIEGSYQSLAVFLPSMAYRLNSFEAPHSQHSGCRYPRAQPDQTKSTT
jgi:hypothetical protein